MASIRHTEFAPFVLDLIDFMEQKIRTGLDDEGARTKAVGEAAGVAPLLHGRLCENEAAQAQAMLLLDKQMYDADAAKWWADLAGVDRAEFEEQALDLLALLAVLRQVAAAGAGT
jgi:hypothetical protein